MKKKIIQGLMQSIASQKQTHDAMIKRLMAQEDALKVAEGALQSMYENGQKQGWNDKYLFSMDRANQALEQIRKVVK